MLHADMSMNGDEQSSGWRMGDAHLVGSGTLNCMMGGVVKKAWLNERTMSMAKSTFSLPLF